MYPGFSYAAHLIQSQYLIRVSHTLPIIKLFEMKKTREFYGNDRLSELHDSLIFDIFKLMPTIDVVRTTILSKRWKNLWKTVPCLDFDDTTMNYKDKDKFRDFINGALKAWRGTRISSFTVKFGSGLWKSVTHRDIDSWVLFATKKNVEDLKLILPEPDIERLYLAPNHLYSCSSLKHIWLQSCDLHVAGNVVQWDQLRSLRICGYRAEMIDLVLSGSPKLEFLFLFIPSTSNKKLSIRSSSLKRLVVTNYSLMDGIELMIRTPNLKWLTITGFPFSRCLMMNVSSLTEVRLFLCDPIHFGGSWMVPRILPVVEHAERVHLTDWCIEALVAMKEKSMPSPFPNVSFLRLEYSFVASEHERILSVLGMIPRLHERILGVLGMFPRLRDLVLHTDLESPRPEYEESWVRFDRNNFPDSFLMHLRTVEITWTKGNDSIFRLIEFIIKCARNLEKMVIWEEGAKPRKLLLKMIRSSPTDHEFILDRTKLYR